MSDTANPGLALKAKGSEAFAGGQYAEAVAFFEQAVNALGASPTVDKSQVVACEKNIAACYLKLGDAKQAIAHCDEALALAPGDVKARFRRAQACELSGDVSEAYKDLRKALDVDPKNTAVIKEARRLHQVVAAKVEKQQSSDGVSSTMLDTALDTTKPLESRRQAIKNCVVLAREAAGARTLWAQNGFQRLVPLLSDDDTDIRVHTIHTFASLCENNKERCTTIVSTLLPHKQETSFTKLLHTGAGSESRAAFRLITLSLECLASSETAMAQSGELITILLKETIACVKNRKLATEVRDAAIHVVMKTVSCSKVGERVIELGGVRALMITAALAPSPLQQRIVKSAEAEGAAALESSASMTRGHVAVCLKKIFEATVVKAKPNEQFVADCISQIRFGEDPVGNIAPANALVAVMQAVVDIGNQVLEQPDVFAHLMGMAKCDNLEAQCVAAEALSHAASDKKRARGIMMEGFPILKRLYSRDLPSPIRVRALCGLCKMASVGAGAKNLRSMSEDSLINLAKKLRPFLVEQGHDDDTRKWAAEGMAYLSLDADVKEYVVHDDAILKAVHAVCLGSDITLQYSLANMLVNISNSFDAPKVSEEQEELKKLGKFAGENIPEPHEKDGQEFVLKRVQKLVDYHFVTALVELSKSESEGTREQVARVLLAFCENQANRGVVIAEGGAKCLITLTRKTTEKGEIAAAHALAKIAITANPSLAFPGQRAAELVKPLVMLTKQRNGLQMFEAAMALTNLASMSDEMRNKILREKGVGRLEDMMFDEDFMIRRAATEAMTNLLESRKVAELYNSKGAPSWDRLKLWILFSGVEQDDFDIATCRAASGGLALLSQSRDVCWRIKEERQGLQIIKELLVCGDESLQHRALFIVNNMIECDKELAKEFLEKEMLMILTAINATTQNKTIKDLSRAALEGLLEHGLITSVDEVLRSAAEAARDMQSARDATKAKAKELSGVTEDDGDDEDDDDEEEEDDEEDVAEVVTVAPEVYDEGSEPKIEIIEDA
eukprot:m.122848 g.122848  ORF g.122848 m.122848 type:complete len:1015 (+) comp13742_c1_seq1:230-3274(+)